MHYTYIIFSSKSHNFYFGSTRDIKKRFQEHNKSLVPSTKHGIPWELVWCGVFKTKKESEDFEQYLKTGSGKSFAYKRLVSVTLKNDFSQGRIGSPKTKLKRSED